MNDAVRIQRLSQQDTFLAQQTFHLLTEVFEEDRQPLGDAYVKSLLARTTFWAFAALEGDTPVGGITAHELPMTRNETTELFIYDLAVHSDHQRQGIGRALVDALRASARERGIHVAFVPADVEDDHALDFYRALGADEADVRFFTFDSSLAE